MLCIHNSNRMCIHFRMCIQCGMCIHFRMCIQCGMLYLRTMPIHSRMRVWMVLKSSMMHRGMSCSRVNVMRTGLNVGHFRIRHNLLAMRNLVNMRHHLLSLRHLLSIRYSGHPIHCYTFTSMNRRMRWRVSHLDRMEANHIPIPIPILILILYIPISIHILT